MDKKQQMEQIVNQFLEQGNQSLPAELEKKLYQVKERLQSMSTDEVEMMSDHVFTSPASEHDHHMNPQAMLQSIYGEMERFSRQEDQQQLQAAMQQMRYVFNIEEKDGFFP